MRLRERNGHTCLMLFLFFGSPSQSSFVSLVEFQTRIKLDQIWLILIDFDQILTKLDQILTIYVKNHQIYVNKIQECHFLKIKRSDVKNHPGFGCWKNVDTSRCWTRKPIFSNIHIYHFHILEFPHLDFSIFLGGGTLMN